jgi:hypothetical protein
MWYVTLRYRESVSLLAMVSVVGCLKRRSLQHDVVVMVCCKVGVFSFAWRWVLATPQSYYVSLRDYHRRTDATRILKMGAT